MNESIGMVFLHLKPTNPQDWERTFHRPVTQEKWERVVKILREGQPSEGVAAPEPFDYALMKRQYADWTAIANKSGFTSITAAMESLTGVAEPVGQDARPRLGFNGQPYRVQTIRMRGGDTQTLSRSDGWHEQRVIWDVDAATSTVPASEPMMAKKKEDKWPDGLVIQSISKMLADGVSEDAIRFVLQLMGASACEACGYVKDHCRCTAPASEPVTAKCDTCTGHGMVGGLMPHPHGYNSQECPDCKGTGEVPDSSFPAMVKSCKPCDGTGTAPATPKAASVDTPEFWTLLRENAEVVYGLRRTTKDTSAALIAHIDQWASALVGAARQEGFKEGEAHGAQVVVTDWKDRALLAEKRLVDAQAGSELARLPAPRLGHVSDACTVGLQSAQIIMTSTEEAVRYVNEVRAALAKAGEGVEMSEMKKDILEIVRLRPNSPTYYIKNVMRFGGDYDDLTTDAVYRILVKYERDGKVQRAGTSSGSITWKLKGQA